jgi:hypothetical protein
MEQIDVICSIVVIASFMFVFGLVIGGPVYAKYRGWKERRAFRLRDIRDAKLRAGGQMGRQQHKKRSAS